MKTITKSEQLLELSEGAVIKAVFTAEERGSTTTIDHQQAAVRVAAGVIAPHAYDKVLWRCTLADGRSMEQTALDAEDTAQDALSAAAPHLRAGIAEEVRNLRSQFHDDAKTAFGRIGSSTQVYLDALDDVLTLLKGGAEDDSIVAEKSEAALPL